MPLVGVRVCVSGRFHTYIYISPVISFVSYLQPPRGTVGGLVGDEPAGPQHGVGDAGGAEVGLGLWLGLVGVCVCVFLKNRGG